MVAFLLMSSFILFLIRMMIGEEIIEEQTIDLLTKKKEMFREKQGCSNVMCICLGYFCFKKTSLMPVTDSNKQPNSTFLF